jgi:hypothetical protein
MSPRASRPAADATRPRRGRVVLAALVAAALGGCASTKMTSTWEDPNVGSVHFRRVVGVALTRDPGLRRLAEDEFVEAVGPAAIAGYQILPDDELPDREAARRRIEATGVDGAIVYRLVGVEKQQRWVPPTTYRSAWGYWGYAGPMVWEPGYLTTDRIVQVETTAYRVSDATLVWAGRSETLNPADEKDLIRGVVDASVAAMRKAGLLP